MRNLNNALKAHLEIAPSTFRKYLLNWFEMHGRKNLPWQINVNPYRVMISEIMLQQTQVKTVIPYFLRFIQIFPDISHLAKASQDEVLHYWAGLGYYSRARNLHKAAKQILAVHQGKIPATLNDLMHLPGIGLSTAGAILSLGFSKPATILDGNVKRVLCRVMGITMPINDTQTQKLLWQIAERFTPKAKMISEYTQAMMDLGATLCTRKNPQCHNCPLQNKCWAYHNNQVTVLPRKKKAVALPIRQKTFLLFVHQQSIRDPAHTRETLRVFLQRRPSSGIWGGLWSFPELDGEPNRDKIARVCQKLFPAKQIKIQETLPTFRHTFTHFHLDIYPTVLKLPRNAGKIVADENEIWYNLDTETAIGLPKPVQTLLSTFAQRYK